LICSNQKSKRKRVAREKKGKGKGMEEAVEIAMELSTIKRRRSLNPKSRLNQEASCLGCRSEIPSSKNSKA
jgi:hypothetical protein